MSTVSMSTYSHTRLAAFEQCPLKYKLKYIDLIETRDESIEAYLGKRVHETLEKLYRDLGEGRSNSIGDLFAFYEWKWKQAWHDRVRMVRRDVSQADVLSYGKRCIQNYFSRNAPFSDSITLYLEHHIEFPLDAQKGHHFQGYADRIACRQDGSLEIHDYKTSRRAPQQKDLDSDRQLGLYQFGLEKQRQDAKRIELIWHYLGLGAVFRSKRTAAQLENTRCGAVRLINKIEQTSEFPAVKTPLCDWCEYRPVCPAWQPVHSAKRDSAHQNRSQPRNRAYGRRRRPEKRSGLLYDLGRLIR